jgi:putative endonuclease
VSTERSASRTAAQLLGDAAESLVARRLERDGWRILGRNVRVGRLELDLVAVDPGPPPCLVVVEVRWRARRDFGLVEETVDHRKRTRLRTAAWALLERGTIGPDRARLPRLSLRIDLVVVEPAADAGAGHDPRVRHHRGIA